VNTVAENAMQTSAGGQKVSENTFALELRDLRKSFGKTEIIRGANLAVKAGERVAVIGPNGVQLGERTLRAHQRRCAAERFAHQRQEAV
jgi:ATPase subunit of ABC transporter with duplicated ATPase domains